MALPLVVAWMMLAVGMGLRTADVTAVISSPGAAAIGLTGMFVAFPLLAFAIAAGFSLEPELAIGLVLLAASPSASTSTIFTDVARGDTALSVALTAVSKVVPVATIPFYVSLAALAFSGERTEVRMSFADTSESVALTVLLPTAAGMAVRHYFPGSVRIRPLVARLAIVALVVLIGVLAFRERNALPQMFVATGPAAVTLCVLGMAFGYAAATLGRQPRARRTAIAIEIGMQSGGTSIAIAAGVLGSPAMAVPAAVYSLSMYVLAGAFALAERTAAGRPALTTGNRT